MTEYHREFRGPLVGPGGEIWRRGRRRGDSRRRRWDELERRLREMPPPGRPARGEPVREIHSYSLDYGTRTGGPFEYSGRAGYAERSWYPDVEAAAPGEYGEETWWPRGVRSPRARTRPAPARRERTEAWDVGYGYGEDYAGAYRGARAWRRRPARYARPIGPPRRPPHEGRRDRATGWWGPYRRDVEYERSYRAYGEYGY